MVCHPHPVFVPAILWLLMPSICIHITPSSIISNQSVIDQNTSYNRGLISWSDSDSGADTSIYKIWDKPLAACNLCYTQTQNIKTNDSSIKTFGFMKITRYEPPKKYLRWMILKYSMYLLLYKKKVNRSKSAIPSIIKSMVDTIHSPALNAFLPPDIVWATGYWVWMWSAEGADKSIYIAAHFIFFTGF